MVGCRPDERHYLPARCGEILVFTGVMVPATARLPCSVTSTGIGILLSEVAPRVVLLRRLTIVACQGMTIAQQAQHGPSTHSRA